MVLIEKFCSYLPQLKVDVQKPPQYCRAAVSKDKVANLPWTHNKDPQLCITLLVKNRTCTWLLIDWKVFSKYWSSCWNKNKWHFEAFFFCITNPFFCDVHLVDLHRRHHVVLEPIYVYTENSPEKKMLDTELYEVIPMQNVISGSHHGI